MIDKAADKPDCFGELETVFPIGEDGFRTTPPECMKCPLVKSCVRTAMQTPDGLREEEERIDRAYECGLIGALERWSQKKLIHQQIEGQTKKAKPRQKEG